MYFADLAMVIIIIKYFIKDLIIIFIIKMSMLIIIIMN